MEPQEAIHVNQDHAHMGIRMETVTLHNKYQQKDNTGRSVDRNTREEDNDGAQTGPRRRL